MIISKPTVAIFSYSVTVVGLSWLATYMFMAAYMPVNGDPSDQPTVVLITGSVSLFPAPPLLSLPAKSQ